MAVVKLHLHIQQNLMFSLKLNLCVVELMSGCNYVSIKVITQKKQDTRCEIDFFSYYFILGPCNAKKFSKSSHNIK